MHQLESKKASGTEEVQYHTVEEEICGVVLAEDRRGVVRVVAVDTVVVGVAVGTGTRLRGARALT